MAFNSESLERGIEQCKNNIKTFEDAIQKERNTIKEYYEMIEQNLKREKLEKEKLLHIEVVIEELATDED